MTFDAFVRGSRALCDTLRNHIMANRLNADLTIVNRSSQSLLNGLIALKSALGGIDESLVEKLNLVQAANFAMMQAAVWLQGQQFEDAVAAQEQALMQAIAHVKSRTLPITSSARPLARPARVKNEVRLERGKVILQANRDDGISWKNMPSHILNTYPDWFPEYRNVRPTGQDKERLQERLRRMARDAEKQAE